jgi:hypothetical protein
MWLRKASGGAAIGQYAWTKPGDVIEVPDSLGEQLLAIPGNDFTVTGPPAVSMPATAADDGSKPAVQAAAGTRGRAGGKTVRE